MTDHILFSDSSTAVSLQPEYSYKSIPTKVQSRTRSKTGAEYVYTFGSFQDFEVPVSFVNCADMTQIYSWWITNAELFWLEPGGSAVSVRITDDAFPLSKRTKPYSTLFEGVINLSTY